MQKIRIALFLSSLTLWTCSADDTYEVCPEYPPLALAERVAADGAVRLALQKVDALLTNASSRLPTGLVATIVYDQHVIFKKGYGKRNVFEKGSGPPRNTDLVRIASITKVFTDMLLYILRDKGLLSLDDALDKHLPGFQMRAAPGSRTRGLVTLRNLASHTSGLPRESPYPCSLNGACTTEQVLEKLSQLMPTMPPERRFHYSNLGIALLGRALGHAMNATADDAYETAIRGMILGPLGMENASFNYDSDTRSRMATGTASDGSRLDFAKVCGPSRSGVSWDAPCGCLWASADDIAELLKLFFRDGPADDTTQILDGDTLHEMLLPSILLRDGSSAVGAPWEMKYSSGVWMKAKQGELPGYRSSVTLVEPLKLGIFVSALVSDVDELSVWTIPSLDLVVPPLMDALRRMAPEPTLPKHAGIYQGSYFDGTVHVNVSGTTLQLQMDGQPPLNLTELPGIEHVLRARPAQLTQGCRWLDDGQDQELVYFDVTGDGLVRSLRFMDSMFERVRPEEANSQIIV